MSRAAEMVEQWERDLLRTIRERMHELESFMPDRGRFCHEDPMYRFYQQSPKLYEIQERTREIASKLQSLAPHLPLHPQFLDIVSHGTGREINSEETDGWSESTKPILDGFLHAHFFLEMVCKYGKELRAPPKTIPSGWAAVLCLFGLR